MKQEIAFRTLLSVLRSLVKEHLRAAAGRAPERLIIPLVVAFISTMSLAIHGQKPLSITVSSGVDLLIVRSDGKRIGRGPEMEKSINEIPGAEILRSPGREPVYDVPTKGTEGPVTITIFGRDAVVDVKLAITGQNFVFGINGFDLAKGASCVVLVSPSGDMIVYSPTTAGKAPRIVLGTDPTDARYASYVFEIGRPPFATADATLKLAFVDGQTLIFGDEGKNAVTYDLKVSRIVSGSKTKEFRSAALSKPPNSFTLDVTRAVPCLRSGGAKSVCVPLRVMP